MTIEDGICPQCNDLLIYPRGSEPYCEECGWPDEDFGTSTKPISEMTQEEKCKELVEMNGGCWHKVSWADNLGEVVECSCGYRTYACKIQNHIIENNPSFTHAKELLEVMMKREEKHDEFFNMIGQYYNTDPPDVLIGLEYILNPTKLLDVCLKWCRENIRRGNERR